MYDIKISRVNNGGYALSVGNGPLSYYNDGYMLFNVLLTLLAPGVSRANFIKSLENCTGSIKLNLND